MQFTDRINGFGKIIWNVPFQDSNKKFTSWFVSKFIQQKFLNSEIFRGNVFFWVSTLKITNKQKSKVGSFQISFHKIVPTRNREI